MVRRLFEFCCDKGWLFFIPDRTQNVWDTVLKIFHF